MSLRPISIFDVTLREGAQAASVVLGPAERLRLALQLEELGVNIVEAGFPMASMAEYEGTWEVAQNLTQCTVAAKARALTKDLDVAWRAIEGAKRPRLHTFISVSQLHMEHVINKTPSQVLDLAKSALEYATDRVMNVEFSAEDAFRADREYLYKVLELALDNGAAIINLTDPAGATTPGEVTELIKDVLENVNGLADATLSVHCHDDLGLALSNALAAIAAGADEVQCSINGLGDRAGIIPLEELIMALAVRPDAYHCLTRIKPHLLNRSSRLTAKLMGVEVASHKAIVGSRAFVHTAGIHQRGVMSNPLTYQIIDPITVGAQQQGVVLSEHSGHHALETEIARLGFKLDAEQLDRVQALVKELARHKRTVEPQDVEAIVESMVLIPPETWRLEELAIAGGSRTTPKVRVKLCRGEECFEAECEGDGPVDAASKAIEEITQSGGYIAEYTAESVTRGGQALVEVRIKLNVDEQAYIGHAVSTDIIEASAKAYLNALNKVLANLGRPSNTAARSVPPTDTPIPNTGEPVGGQALRPGPVGGPAPSLED